MNVKITRKIESYISGNTLSDCINSYYNGDNFMNDFNELVSVIDTDTGEEITEKWMIEDELMDR